jgi:predicted O-methyltransferase YrrM
MTHRIDFPCFLLRVSSIWKGVSIYTGDQADPIKLMEINKKAGPFDVIVDDGGHSMKQQITSLRTLFPLLKPGGLYFLEDVGTSYVEEYQDGEDGITTMDYIIELVHQIHAVRPHRLDAKFQGIEVLRYEVKSVECSEGMCMFTKWSQKENEMKIEDVT